MERSHFHKLICKWFEVPSRVMTLMSIVVIKDSKYDYTVSVLELGSSMTSWNNWPT